MVFHHILKKNYNFFKKSLVFITIIKNNGREIERQLFCDILMYKFYYYNGIQRN